MHFLRAKITLEQNPSDPMISKTYIPIKHRYAAVMLCTAVYVNIHGMYAIHVFFLFQINFDVSRS